MARSDRLRAALMEQCGDLDRFLSRSPVGITVDGVRTTTPLVGIVVDGNADIELRLAASRALIDVALRAELSGAQARQLCDVAFSTARSDLRLNCILVVLPREEVDRTTVNQELAALGADSDPWVSAVARVIVVLRRECEDVLATATPFLESTSPNEVAAALCLLQDAPASERIFRLALARSNHSCPRVRIVACRLAILQSIRLCSDIARRLAKTMSPRTHDSNPGVRSLLASVLGLFPNGAALVAEITAKLETDPDSWVRAAMQSRWTHGRLMEFPA